MTAYEFNKLSNYEKLEIISSVPQPPVEITRLNTGAARFFVHSRNGKRHRIFGNDIAWCKAGRMVIKEQSAKIPYKIDCTSESFCQVWQ